MKASHTASALSPLSLPVQAGCFLLYLVFLWVLPHEWGLTGIRRHELAWQWARLGLVLLFWLPLMTLVIRRQAVSRWSRALLGAWLPLVWLVCLIGLMPEALHEDYLRADGASALGMAHSDGWGYESAQLTGYIGTAFAYSWLTLSYCSPATRWWTALLRGTGILALMLIVDLLVLAAVTGPQRFH